MATTRTQRCPECEGRLEAGKTETICGECGLVVDIHPIDPGPDWRSFANDDTDPERTGAPLTRSRHDRGLSTEIGRSTRLKGRKRRRISRIRRQHKRTQIRSKTERNRVYGFTEIRRIIGMLDLPQHVQERACRLFESAQDAALLQGRSIEGFAAAAVYAACRVSEISRTLGEVTDVSKASRAELDAAYDAMNRELGLPTGPVHPAQYIPRFASKLGISRDVERTASVLADRAREAGIDNGRNPCGVAAACLYTASEHLDEDLTQADAASVADVTPVTLRRTYTELVDGEIAPGDTL